jgi:hypothetical protein
MRECWRCLEEISDVQRVCPYCGAETTAELVSKDSNQENWLDGFKYIDLCSRLFWPALALLLLEAFTKITRTVTNESEWLIIYTICLFVFCGVCKAAKSGVLDGRFYTVRRAEKPTNFNIHVNVLLVFCALIFIIGTYELYKYFIQLT